MDDLLSELFAGIIFALNYQENAKLADAVKTKGHRVKVRELVEVYNNLTRRPMSSIDSPEKNVSTPASAKFSCPKKLSIEVGQQKKVKYNQSNLSILFLDESESNFSLSSFDNEQSSENRILIFFSLSFFFPRTKCIIEFPFIRSSLRKYVDFKKFN